MPTTDQPDDDQSDVLSDGESLDLPCEVASVATARRALVASLGATSASELLVRDAATVLSELLMNAIVHGRADETGCVQATWWRDESGVLTISVRDAGGGGRPHVEAPGDGEGGGRGLALVDRLSRRWWTTTDDGTVVQAELSPDRRLSGGAAG